MKTIKTIEDLIKKISNEKDSNLSFLGNSIRSDFSFLRTAGTLSYFYFFAGHILGCILALKSFGYITIEEYQSLGYELNNLEKFYKEKIIVGIAEHTEEGD